jgi:hypothetical protein
MATLPHQALDLAEAVSEQVRNLFLGKEGAARSESIFIVAALRPHRAAGPVLRSHPVHPQLKGRLSSARGMYQAIGARTRFSC